MTDHIKVGELITRLQKYDKTKPVYFGNSQNALHFDSMCDREKGVQLMFYEVVCRDGDGKLIAYDP